MANQGKVAILYILFSSEVIYIYTIQINLESETFNNTEHYFWCILKKENNALLNCGHGWAKSIESAASTAYQFFCSNISNESNHIPL